MGGKSKGAQRTKNNMRVSQFKLNRNFSFCIFYICANLSENFALTNADNVLFINNLANDKVHGFVLK